MSILVIGDSMIDTHLYGKVDRISPEAPVPVVNAIREESFLGGSANVAAHMTSAGLNSTFTYKSYNDSSSQKLLSSMLSQKGIKELRLPMNKYHPVSIKKRIWTGSQQICRIDYEDTSKPNADLECRWLEIIINKLMKEDFGVVIFSDYDKGTLTDTLIQGVVNFCKSNNIKTILDPKRPTFYQIEDLDIVKPNKLELDTTNLTAEQCSKKLSHTYLVNTLGREGIEVWRHGILEYSCPTCVREVRDVTGAGDTVCAMLAIALNYNLSINDAVIASNRLAAYTISHIGAYVPTNEEINSCLP